MKPRNLTLVTLCFAIAMFLNNSIGAQPKDRDEINFNFDWKFYKGDIPNGQSVLLDDSGWRILDVPHDWSIEGEFNKALASSTAYLPAGIGWYRKTFSIPSEEKNRKVFISFDGIYNNSEVWINGTSFGKRPNGYISFS